MREVCSTARNIYFVKADDGTMVPIIEVIITVSEPQFLVDAAGEIVTHRQTETIRFCTNPRGLEQIMANMADWIQDAESIAEAAVTGTAGFSEKKDGTDG